MTTLTTNTDRGTKIEIFVNSQKVESVHIFQSGEKFYISDDIDCVEFESYEEALNVIMSRVNAPQLQGIEEAIQDTNAYGACIVTAYSNAHPTTRLRFLNEAKKYIGKTDFKAFITAHYIQNTNFINRMLGVTINL